MGPVSGLLEVKQQYFAPTLFVKALSNSRDELRLKTIFFRYVFSATASTFLQLSSSSISTLSTIVLTLKAVIVVVVDLSIYSIV